MTQQQRHVDEQLAMINAEISLLLDKVGSGRMEGGAYDTGWVARLDSRYPNMGFDACLEWLRENQYEDGTWGAPLVHYHDRYISTLSAIIALHENGRHPKDERRVRRGEDSLWKTVGYLNKDDSDTVGFPLLAAALTREATALGLDVPQPPIRFETSYQRKVQMLMQQPPSFWHGNAITASLEGVSTPLPAESLLAENGSVAGSPAATASVLMRENNPRAMAYLCGVLAIENTGRMPNFTPIDTFEISWCLNSLRSVGAIQPNEPRVAMLLDYLCSSWSTTEGMTYSRSLKVCDLDDTVVSMLLLRWAGYAIDADILYYYERDDHFCCYPNETDPSPSAHARTLSMLKFFPEHPSTPKWTEKIINALDRYDANGIFWWDKWHASTYYTTSIAIDALHDIATEFAAPRLKWILRTQRDDGGWGSFGTSTAEETAYALYTLTLWHQRIAPVPMHAMDKAASYLITHLNKNHQPIWIGKSLFTPPYMVRAAILGALYGYYTN
jgi:halimadienyl-diphosphate synthase